MASSYDAIASIESAGSGGYGAIGPVTRSGARAYGKHQVMDYNIGPWTEKVLGRAYTPQEYLADPDAQDKVFRSIFGDYEKKYGPQGAAAMWFSGSPNVNSTASDGYNTVQQYVGKFNNALGKNDVSPISQVFPSASRGGNTTPDDGSLSAKFIAGGPGALFGAPDGVFQKADGSQGYDLGNGIIGAGAALASISDAKQGAAIAQLAGGKDGYDTHYDQNTGTLFRVNKKTGAVQASRNPNWEGQKVDPTVLKSLQEDWGGKYGAIQQTAERAKYFKDAIDSGKLDLGLWQQWVANPAANIFGGDEAKKQLYNDFNAFKTQMANASLRLNAGVQTEGDAQRAMQEFSNGSAQYDNGSVSKALHNVINNSRKVMHESAKTQLEALNQSYNNPRVFQPYYDRLTQQQKFYTDYDESEKAKAQPKQPSQGNSAPAFKILNVR